MSLQVWVAAVCQLCAGLSQPEQHQRSSDCWSLPLQMELDRAEAATQELLTAAEQLQRENTQLSAENEVCKLLGPMGCSACDCAQAREQTRETPSQHGVMYGSPGRLFGCQAQQAHLIVGPPAVQSLKKEVGSLSTASKRLTEAQKQQNGHEGGASTV